MGIDFENPRSPDTLGELIDIGAWLGLALKNGIMDDHRWKIKWYQWDDLLRKTPGVDTLTMLSKADGDELIPWIDIHLGRVGTAHYLDAPAVKSLSPADFAGKLLKLLQLASKQTDGEASDNVSLDARALAVFIEHPNWSKVQIAKDLVCNAKSLAPKRCPKLAAAREAYKAPNLPRGSKDASGNIEAWE